jgi:catechol 2,3-dioxygenase
VKAVGRLLARLKVSRECSGEDRLRRLLEGAIRGRQPKYRLDAKAAKRRTGSLPRLERVDQRLESLRGAGALRFDYYRVHSPDVEKSAAFYAGLGLRIVDYMVVGAQPVGALLHAKDTVYDVVFVRRRGPALHHYGYIVGGINEIVRACDVTGRLGYGDDVEFGPGRHSLGQSYYVYLLDPDGHRVE